MIDLYSLFKKDINLLIGKLQKDKIIDIFDVNKISIDYSSKSKQGDVSTNLFLIIIKYKLDEGVDFKKLIEEYFLKINYIDSINFAKAGFININFKKESIILYLNNILNNNIEYENVNNKNINIEFVSANPTGPLHVAHMRGAVFGDVLSSLLKTVGYKITKEYYVNNAGSQIKTLGISLFKRYQELFKIKVDILENEYPGEYLIEIAKIIRERDEDKWLSYKNTKYRDEYFETFAVNYLIENIKLDLSLININFDQFTFESNIVKDHYIDEVFKILSDNNLIYKGILAKPLGEDDNNWEPREQLLFRSTNFSDSVDRPFKKSNGEWTYFANDSAYHLDKFKRGFDKLINIWGSDHIGYISRMKSITDVIAKKKNYLEIYICQIVRLIKDDKVIKMSKREGNFVSVKDIFNEVGKDPLRYFMISSKNETPMDFNLNKVIEKNKDNPVFYCQYAYARASSLINKAKKIKDYENINYKSDKIDKTHISQYEWEIILKIISWPYIVQLAATSKQPHRITIYLEDLCSYFHSFWNKGKEDESLRFLDEINHNKTISKLIWIMAFRHVLKQAFEIIGIDCNETM